MVIILNILIGAFYLIPIYLFIWGTTSLILGNNEQLDEGHWFYSHRLNWMGAVALQLSGLITLLMMAGIL